jgi:hypothetical protein
MQVFSWSRSKLREKYLQDAGIPVTAANPRILPTGHIPVTAAKPGRSIHKAQVFRSLQQTTGEVSTGHRFSGHCSEARGSAHRMQAFSGHRSRPREKYPQGTGIPVTTVNHRRSIHRTQVFRSLHQTRREVSTGHRYSGHCSKPGEKFPQNTGFRSLQQTQREVPTGHGFFDHCSEARGSTNWMQVFSGHCSRPEKKYPQDTGIRVTAANQERSTYRTQVFRSLHQTRREVSTGHRYSGHCSKPGEKFPQDTGFRSLQQTQREVPTGHGFSGHCSEARGSTNRMQVFCDHCSRPGEKYPQDTGIPVTAASPERSTYRTQVFRSLQQTRRKVFTGHRYSGHWSKPLGNTYRIQVFSGHCSKP